MRRPALLLSALLSTALLAPRLVAATRLRQPLPGCSALSLLETTVRATARSLHALRADTSDPSPADPSPALTTAQQPPRPRPVDPCAPALNAACLFVFVAAAIERLATAAEDFKQAAGLDEGRLSAVVARLMS